jgi:hypothetical protein
MTKNMGTIDRIVRLILAVMVDEHIAKANHEYRLILILRSAHTAL